jgi:hypothetical protein
VNWRCLNVRLQGTGHIASDLPCQDFSLCEQFSLEEAPVLVLLVADGAGSASHGGIGSQLACEAVLLAVRDWIDEWDTTPPVFTQKLIRSWVQQARDQLITSAEAVGKLPRDFACTLLGSVIKGDTVCYFQIGDGAIVALSEPERIYEPVFWPQSGEYSNTTFFLSDEDWEDKILIDLAKVAPAELAMFSDGLQGLLLVAATQKAHQSFFQKSFALLRNTEKDIGTAQEALEGTFRSPMVTERTDDDISLVLASRQIG